MQVSEESSGFYNDRLVNAPECVAVLYPAQQSAYQNSGATTTYTQIVNPVDTQIKASVVQPAAMAGAALRLSGAAGGGSVVVGADQKERVGVWIVGDHQHQQDNV